MKLFDTHVKLQIFHVLAAIIERLGADVQPFTSGFLQLLPTVWQQAEGQQMVQMQVTASLNRACFCIKSDNPQLVMPAHHTRVLACQCLQQKERCPALPHCMSHSSAQLLVACPHLPELTHCCAPFKPYSQWARYACWYFKQDGPAAVFNSPKVAASPNASSHWHVATSTAAHIACFPP